jgi:ribosomal-protein-alanine N-acetyltransferase
MTMPTLDTARLRIRPFVQADLDAIHLILDVESGAVELDDTEGLAAVKTARREWLAWSVLNYPALARLHQPPYGDRAIVLRATGEVIGACGFAPVMLPFGQLPAFRPAAAAPDQPARNTHEMGLYWEISSHQQRQGYATETGAALIRYAFTELNLQRIVATTSYDNVASIGVMRKLGMAILRNPLPEPPWMQIVGVLEFHAGSVA